MKYVIGIDIGGSTTKIVGFTEEGALIQPFSVRAADPLTSTYGAFGKFTAQNGIELGDISRVMTTGVGSSYLSTPIYGLSCKTLPEFACVGRGGLYLSGLDDCIVVSMGTGTSIVHASRDGKIEYLGGTGVGGGTLIGLSRLLLGMEDVNHVVSLAKDGDLNKIDLRIKDITNKDILPGMPSEMTAANFGKVSDLASKADTALGILNMVYETIGMCAIFAARKHNIRDIVLTGNLSAVPQCRPIFTALNDMFNVNFTIPDLSQFGPVIGAALGE